LRPLRETERELRNNDAIALSMACNPDGHVPKGIVPVPGGVLIRDASGALLGAVGVSGDTSDNDEVCAVAGIAAAGLVADTGA
jgi:uncharacterized protein GlcG (DUF336 family)